MSAADNAKIQTNATLHASPQTTTTTTTTAAAATNYRMLSNGEAAAAAAMQTKTTATNATTMVHKLSSLGPPRDLTLGGRGLNILANKKTFAPNLNVTRNKNVNVKTSKDTSARNGRARSQVKVERSNSNARGGGSIGRNNSTLVQTAGVFSEGAGAVMRKLTSGAGAGGVGAGGGGGGGGGVGSYGRNAAAGDDSANSLRKPVICKTETKLFGEKDNKSELQELIGDSDDDDLLEEKCDLHQLPIKLSNNKRKPIKMEIKLEKLDINEDDVAQNHMENSLDLARKQHTEELYKIQNRENRAYGNVPIYPKSVEELLQTTEQTLFIMQLPDILPCLNDDDDNEQQNDKTNTETATNSATTENSSTAQRSDSLKTLNEGQVGKLLRYKSGKVKLVLGESRFDVTMGMQPGFLQELMSISTNAEERNGDIINLGPIQAKLTASPDWEYIFQNQQNKNS